MGNVDDNTLSTAENEAHGVSGNGIEDWQRQAILALARDGLSRRKVSARVFGNETGRDYEKVKVVLDEAGL